jgi:hypothetical protein
MASGEEDRVGCILTFCGTLLLLGIGCAVGHSLTNFRWQQDGIKRGVGEWTVTKNGYPEWKWKVEEVETTHNEP